MEKDTKQGAKPVQSHVKPRRDARGRWLPGQSGNESGLFKPGNGAAVGNGRKNSVSDLLNRLGDIPTDNGTMRQQLADKLYQMALGGDINAIKVCLDRMDGRVREELQVTEIISDEVVIK